MINKLVCTPFFDTKYKRAVFLMLEDFHFININGDENVIQAGFKFDGCSRPSILEPLIPLNSAYNSCWAVHDWQYFKQETSRKKADDLLLQNLKKIDIDLDLSFNNSHFSSSYEYVKSNMIYKLIRIFGGRAWNLNFQLIKNNKLDYFMEAEYVR